MVSRGTGPIMHLLYSGTTSCFYCEPMNVPPPTQSNPILPPVEHFPIPSLVPDPLRVYPSSASVPLNILIKNYVSWVKNISI